MLHASDEDTVDSEARRDGFRIHFRIQAPLKAKLEEAGDALGLESISLAARHFMLLGLQHSLGQLAQGRLVAAQEQMAASMQDSMRVGMEVSAAVDRASAAGLQPRASILDTKATSPDGKRGSKG